MSEQKQSRLKHYIQENAEELHRIVHQYVLRMGLAAVDGASAVTDEIVQDMVIEALNHANRLPDEGEPLPWLLSIAMNLIKRRRSNHARLNYREPLVRDLYSTDDLSDGEIYDRFFGTMDNEPYESIDSQQFVERFLEQIPEDDAQIIRLAVIDGLSGKALGKALGISAGAARVRLHRALKRQRHLVSRAMNHHD